MLNSSSWNCPQSIIKLKYMVLRSEKNVEISSTNQSGATNAKS